MRPLEACGAAERSTMRWSRELHRVEVGPIKDRQRRGACEPEPRHEYVGLQDLWWSRSFLASRRAKTRTAVGPACVSAARVAVRWRGGPEPKRTALRPGGRHVREGGSGIRRGRGRGKGRGRARSLGMWVSERGRGDGRRGRLGSTHLGDGRREWEDAPEAPEAPEAARRWAALSDSARTETTRRRARHRGSWREQLSTSRVLTGQLSTNFCGDRQAEGERARVGLRPRALIDRLSN